MARTLNEILDLKQDGAEAESAGRFIPRAPENLEQTGLKETFLKDLVCKILLSHGSLSGREIAHIPGLPLKIISDLLYDLKQRLILAYRSTSGLNDFDYVLTETGKQKALLAREYSNYIGAAPVTFADYLAGIEKQSILNEHPGREDLVKAFENLALPLPGKLMEHLTKVHSELIIEYFPSTFRYLHYMVLCLPILDSNSCRSYNLSSTLYLLP